MTSEMTTAVYFGIISDQETIGCQTKIRPKSSLQSGAILFSEGWHQCSCFKL